MEGITWIFYRELDFFTESTQVDLSGWLGGPPKHDEISELGKVIGPYKLDKNHGRGYLFIFCRCTWVRFRFGSLVVSLSRDALYWLVQSYLRVSRG